MIICVGGKLRIQISWLHLKPADLDLQYFQKNIANCYNWECWSMFVYQVKCGMKVKLDIWLFQETMKKLWVDLLSWQREHFSEAASISDCQWRLLEGWETSQP